MIKSKVRRLTETKPIIQKLKKRRTKSPRTQRIEKLDTMWSLAVRLRDNYTDRKTGVRDMRKGHMEAMHIFSRANYSTRWLIENGLTGSYYTHIMWAHRNPVEFTLWAQEEVGEQMWKRLLEAYQHPVKLTDEYMDEVEKRLLMEIDDMSLTGELA